MPWNDGEIPELGEKTEKGESSPIEEDDAFKSDTLHASEPAEGPTFPGGYIREEDYKEREACRKFSIRHFTLVSNLEALRRIHHELFLRDDESSEKIMFNLGGDVQELVEQYKEELKNMEIAKYPCGEIVLPKDSDDLFLSGAKIR